MLKREDAKKDFFQHAPGKIVSPENDFLSVRDLYAKGSLISDRVGAILETYDRSSDSVPRSRYYQAGCES